MKALTYITENSVVKKKLSEDYEVNKEEELYGGVVGGRNLSTNEKVRDESDRWYDR